jgi:ABC-type glycerol-3-phosphate transport system substrate-binding protein
VRPLRLLIAAVLSFVVSSTLRLHGADTTVEVRLNGRSIATYTPTELDVLAVDLPYGRGRGVSLLDLSPLLVECVRLEAIGTATRLTLDAEESDSTDLADRFHDITLLLDPAPVPARPTLIACDESGTTTLVESVERIDLTGDRLTGNDLEVWVSWEGTRELSGLIDGFARRHDLDVTVVEVASVRSKLLTVYRAGGRMPDVVMVSGGDLPEYVGLGLLQPADPVVDHSHALSGAEAFTVAGRVWALPFYFDTQLVYYRPDLVAPPTDHPWSLEEFTGILASLADDHDAPAAWNAYSAYWLIPFLFAFGRESIADSNGVVTVADAATRSAVEYLVDLHRAGHLVVLERDAMFGRFLRGEAGLVLSGSYSIPMLERNVFDYRIAGLPAELEPLRDYKGFAITARSRRSLLARRLLQHLASAPVQSAFGAELSKIPARRDADSGFEGSGPGSNPEVLRANAGRGVTIPPVTGYTNYKNTMWQLLRLVFSQELRIDEALAAGERIMQGGTK